MLDACMIVSTKIDMSVLMIVEIKKLMRKKVSQIKSNDLPVHTPQANKSKKVKYLTRKYSLTK